MPMIPNRKNHRQAFSHQPKEIQSDATTLK